MSSSEELIVKQNISVRYFKNMPIIFPLTGLFLLAMFLFETWSWIGEDGVSALYKLRPVVLLAYFVFWSAACLKKKWGAMAFLILTILNVSFYFFAPDMMLKRAIGDILFKPLPINLLFSFLLLFFFRKFD